MDNFTELLLKKEKTGKEIMLQVLCWSVSVLFIAVLCFIFLKINFVLLILLPILIALMIYGNVIITNMMNVEFEYSLVNNYIDIDKIIGASKRTKILSIKTQNITEIGKFDYKEINREQFSHTLTPVSSLSADNLWYFKAEDDKGETYFVVFEPNRRVLNHLKKFITRNISKGVLDEF